MMRKHKGLKGHKTKTARLLARILEKKPDMFAHWKHGLTGGFA
jgi:hypothetical protein